MVKTTNLWKFPESCCTVPGDESKTGQPKESYGKDLWKDDFEKCPGTLGQWKVMSKQYREQRDCHSLMAVVAVTAVVVAVAVAVAVAVVVVVVDVVVILCVLFVLFVLFVLLFNMLDSTSSVSPFLLLNYLLVSLHVSSHLIIFIRSCFPLLSQKLCR